MASSGSSSNPKSKSKNDIDDDPKFKGWQRPLDQQHQPLTRKPRCPQEPAAATSNSKNDEESSTSNVEALNQQHPPTKKKQKGLPLQIDYQRPPIVRYSYNNTLSISKSPPAHQEEAVNENVQIPDCQQQIQPQEPVAAQGSGGGGVNYEKQTSFLGNDNSFIFPLNYNPDDPNPSPNPNPNSNSDSPPAHQEEAVDHVNENVQVPNRQQQIHPQEAVNNVDHAVNNVRLPRRDENIEKLTSFLDNHNSFFMPWSWNPNEPSPGPNRRMVFDKASFFSPTANPNPNPDPNASEDSSATKDP